MNLPKEKQLGALAMIIGAILIVAASLPVVRISSFGIQTWERVYQNVFQMLGNISTVNNTWFTLLGIFAMVAFIGGVAMFICGVLLLFDKLPLARWHKWVLSSIVLVATLAGIFGIVLVESYGAYFTVPPDAVFIGVPPGARAVGGIWFLFAPAAAWVSWKVISFFHVSWPEQFEVEVDDA